jgi:hypothetical protein
MQVRSIMSLVGLFKLFLAKVPYAKKPYLAQSP